MSHENHPRMKTTFEKLAAQAATLREEHAQAHGGVFDIYEFAKEQGVTHVHHIGEKINIWATDDNNQEWGCNIPECHKQDTARFLLAVLVGWVILRDKDSPNSFYAYDPIDVLIQEELFIQRKSSEEIRAELFAYYLMVPEYALADTSITSLYNTASSQRFMDAVSDGKDSIATELGVPPIIVANYAELRWGLHQAKKQEELRNEQREAMEAARRSRLDTYSSSSRTRRRDKWSY